MKSNITKSDLIRESCTNELENCRVKSLSGEPHTNYFLFDYLKLFPLFLKMKRRILELEGMLEAKIKVERKLRATLTNVKP